MQMIFGQPSWSVQLTGSRGPVPVVYVGDPVELLVAVAGYRDGCGVDVPAWVDLGPARINAGAAAPRGDAVTHPFVDAALAGVQADERFVVGSSIVGQPLHHGPGDSPAAMGWGRR